MVQWEGHRTGVCGSPVGASGVDRGVSWREVPGIMGAVLGSDPCSVALAHEPGVKTSCICPSCRPGVVLSDTGVRVRRATSPCTKLTPTSLAKHPIRAWGIVSMGVSEGRF